MIPSQSTLQAPVLPALLLVVVSSFSLLGCQDPQPRQLPFPRFDPAQPFDLATNPANESSQSTSAEPTGFADQRTVTFGERRESQDFFYPLGGGLVGSLTSPGWQCARSDNLTLLLHPQEGPPDAIVFLRSFATGVSASIDHARFQRTVLPQLPASAWRPLATSSPALRRLTAELATNTELNWHQAARQLEALLTPTLGQGLGLNMETGRFSGWKWIGRNDHRVEIRLGRSTGIWGPSQDDEELQAVLDYLEFYDSDTLDTLRGVLDDSSTAPLPARAAYLLFGSAQQNGLGIHMAMLCPNDCPVRSQLTELLASLRPTAETITLQPCSNDPYDLFHLAKRARIPLLDESQQLKPQDLADLAPSLEPAVEVGGETPPSPEPPADEQPIPEAAASSTSEPSSP